MKKKEIVVSSLPNTWIFDVDGVIFVHNSHLEGEDRLVPGFLELYQQIPDSDSIVIMSAREEQYREKTKEALDKFQIRYDHLLFDMPKGERILINDAKPQGLQTAIATNTKRDDMEGYQIVVDKDR